MQHATNYGQFKSAGSEYYVYDLAPVHVCWVWKSKESKQTTLKK